MCLFCTLDVALPVNCVTNCISRSRRMHQPSSQCPMLRDVVAASSSPLLELLGCPALPGLTGAVY